MSTVADFSFNHALLSSIRGLRNGLIYGARIRFPHALVMTFMFKRHLPFDAKMRRILKATWAHARTLGFFVFIYKSVVSCMRFVRQKDSGINSLVAGFIGGGLMFGAENPINSQINMYIMSRVIWGVARTFVNHELVSSWKHSFRLYGAVCWSLVMYLFFYQDKVLQKSMANVMTFLYVDSDKYSTDLSEWLNEGFQQLIK